VALKPFKPGQSGNPNGRPKDPPDIKEAKKLTTHEMIRILNKFNHWTIAQLKEFCLNENNTVLEMMVARIMIKGIKDGTPTNLTFLFDRLIGKVKDQVEVSYPKPTVIKTVDGGSIVLGTSEKKETE
jgi:hypothetical protein